MSNVFCLKWLFYQFGTTFPKIGFKQCHFTILFSHQPYPQNITLALMTNQNSASNPNPTPTQPPNLITTLSLKKYVVLVCLIIVSLMALVCEKSNGRYLVRPGQVKTRAKELDNKQGYNPF